MRSIRIVGVIVAALAIVTACSGAQSPAPTGSNGGGGGGGGTGSSGAGSGSGASGTATGSSGPIAGPVDPCSLLTQAEVSTVLGQAVGPGSSADDPHACDWTFVDSSDVLTRVSASATTNINANTFAKLCGPASYSAAIPGITVFPVSGIGDSACITETNGLGTNLAFQKGGRAFTISVLAFGKLHDTFSNAVAEAAEKVLAAKAAARV